MRSFWKYIFTVLVLIASVVWLAVIYYPDRKLHLIACDVGQGDAILAIYGNTQILIDGGENNKVLDCLASHMPFWDRKIEVVLLTHPQIDHFGGLRDVFRRFQVEYFLATGLDSSTQAYQALKNAVGGSDARVVNPTSDMVIRLGSLYLDVVWPTSDFIAFAADSLPQNVLGAYSSKEDPNDYSIVANLRLGEFEALLTGDIGPEVIDKVLKTGEIRDVEYIKVPHHGSKNGLTRELLDASMPEIAILSVGKNHWGHPHKEILDLLDSAGILVKRTDLEGDIEIVSDGKSWWIKN